MLDSKMTSSLDANRRSRPRMRRATNRLATKRRVSVIDNGTIVAPGQETAPKNLSNGFVIDGQEFNQVVDKSPRLRVIPLGGLGEYGKNMMVYEYGKDIIVVDCGIMFPEEEMLGIDFVIADITYLIQNKDRIRALILTHGHEDHIGGIPYLWPKLGVPIYGSNLTCGLIKVKLAEFGITGARLNIVSPGESVKFGIFEVEFFRLAHSIPDALGFAIHTPEGLFLHVTDWKFDHTPTSGQPTDAGKLSRYGQMGVKCLLSDSTNVEVPGYTISERVVGETFDRIFKNAQSRIIVTSFASLINRIQQVFDSATRHHRKVAISGFSMERNIEMALDLGFLRIKEGILIDIKKANTLPDNEVVILCTGSQGEEYSALVRMASGEHPHIKIKPGDTVVISASPIPGNEQSISQTIDNLFKEGADVVYGREVDIHVSGHASQEELKMLIALTKPEYFIPVHGEYRHLKKHAALAKRMEMIKPDNIFVIENGQVAEFDKGKGKITSERVQAGYVLVDGLGVGDVGQIVLRDRQAMAKDGIFVAILTVDRRTGKILTSPDIISRGFVYMRAAEDLIHKARQEVKNIFSRHNEKYPLDWAGIKLKMREELGEFLFKETQRRPMVIPVIIET